MEPRIFRLTLPYFQRRLPKIMLSVLVLTSVKLFAQVSNVTDVEATPIPGAGHDYLGTLDETVNPANGSLGLKVVRNQWQL